jgi:hypothetical protein
MALLLQILAQAYERQVQFEPGQGEFRIGIFSG